MRTIILNTDSLLNPGDTAIVLAQIDVLKSVFPGLAISLTSRTPSLDRRFFEPRGVSVWPPLIPAPSLTRGIASKILRSAGQVLAVTPKKHLVAAIRASDFVVSCGGGSLYSNRRTFPGPTFFQNIFHVRLAQAMGKPVVFFPQSFGPFGSAAARNAVLGILGHPQTVRIFVRETLSFDALRRLAPPSVRDRMELCPDMALRLKPVGPALPDPRIDSLPRPRLAVTMRNWDFPEAHHKAERAAYRRRYLQVFTEAVRRFVRDRKGSVMIVPHTRGPGDFEDDRIISRQLWDRLADTLPAGRRIYLDFPLLTSPFRFLDVYSRADVVLGTRMHSVIFALLSGTPAVSVHYQPKGLGIMTMLGLAHHSLPIEDLSEDTLTGALQTAAAESPVAGRLIGTRIAALRAEQEDRLRHVLENLA